MARAQVKKSVDWHARALWACRGLARSSKQSLTCAGQRDGSRVDEPAAVFGETALDGDRIVKFHGVPVPAQTHQAIRASQLDGPKPGFQVSHSETPRVSILLAAQYMPFTAGVQPEIQRLAPRYPYL